MTNNTGKVIQYLDAALCFIEYGMALESDAPAPKSASSVFRDTIKLLKLITTTKSFLDSSSSSHEKILLVLSMRCQSVLHMAMLRHKRGTVRRYCRILSNHFERSLDT
ncbi:AF4/FMR2 family member 1-like [Pogoniulus pusillus]|uniref:AF4/FMR2 family member 1-like n=1 Tax=Pogoniulus pusillus TaxID=488313 RepID=UPI0030B99A87